MQQFVITTSPHIRQARSVSETMRLVLYALLPGIAVYIGFFGIGVLINIALATLTALAGEALILYLRKRPIQRFLGDYSAVVTAWLLALALPPLLPWWMVVLATAFAIIFAKQLYGGLGCNPFNPAMVGYVLLLISFPLEMTRWLAPAGIGEGVSLLDSLSISFFEQTWDGSSIDAVTGATPLDYTKTQLAQMQTMSDVQQHPLFTNAVAAGWQWVNLAYLLGGCWLIYMRVIRWHIPVAMLGSLFVIASLFYIIDSDLYASPLFHLFSGAAILGAFFIATDPVSAATSNIGKLWFAGGIGVLAYVIRTWGGYPDGVAFGVLLMNLTVPALDYMTQPRVFGKSK